MHDPINHPKHYTEHPSGVECIEISERMNFCVGNAIKYCFRSGHKGGAVEDIKKAIWYANRELENVSRRHAVRGFGPGQCEVYCYAEGSKACGEQEGLHDLAVFKSDNASLRSCNGLGDVCWSKARGDDSLPSERQSFGQSYCESHMGVGKEQHSTETKSRYGACWCKTMVSQADRRTGQVGKNMQFVFSGSCIFSSCKQSTNFQDTPWAKLGSYLAYEEETWRRKAIFFLVTGQLKNAIDTLNDELKRLMT